MLFLIAIKKFPRYTNCTSSSQTLLLDPIRYAGLCAKGNFSKSQKKWASRGTWQIVGTDFYKRPNGQVVQNLSLHGKSTSQG